MCTHVHIYTPRTYIFMDYLHNTHDYSKVNILYESTYTDA